MSFVLIRREIEDVVGIQIQNEPYSDNNGKHDKARTVFHGRKKRNQKKPEGEIISLPNEGERVHERLFNENVVS